jgi:Animal haem peroxidase
MPRLSHGTVVKLEDLRETREALAKRSADETLAFAALTPVDTQDFGFLLPRLQQDPDNLLPVARKTRDDLVALGRTVRDTGGQAGGGNARIPAAYTYFGQFVDHDITLETVSATLPELFDPDLEPLRRTEIRDNIRNARTATLELDSVYGLPAPRAGARMEIGRVEELGATEKPSLRPPGKDDANDLPREPRSQDPQHDRAALIGDPRNDENTIVAQLHLAFLLAHNKLVDGGENFAGARRILRRHYQHIVLHDFLKRVADPQVVDDTIEGNRVFDPTDDRFSMPLEFSVAAYRFGHSMVRADYDFNLNFNKGGEPGTFPATLGLLFTFSALSGQLGEFETLPENWIIEWENFLNVGGPFNRARSIDTKLVEPLFALPNLRGIPLTGDRARLAVRNLLRGYLLRLPTGQAVARALRDELSGIRDVPVLTPDQIRSGAASADQVQALESAGFLERTPLWFYVLAEASALEEGERLGPVGSTIVAEVLVGLVRRSENSILRAVNWEPTLPAAEPGEFTLGDLLRFAGVL